MANGHFRVTIKVMITNRDFIFEAVFFTDLFNYFEPDL